MLGTVVFVDTVSGQAVLRADDGRRYRFAVDAWPAGAALAAGQRVDFEADGDRAVDPLPAPPEVDLPAAASVAPAPTVSPTPIASGPAPEPAPEPAPVIAAGPEPIAPPEPIATPSGSSLRAQINANDPPMDDAPSPEPYHFDAPPAEASNKGWLIAGGAVMLFAVGGLGYMMWDNAPGERAEVAASGAAVTLFAQEDLPVRNAASMTNSTVLGRIARGDRVSGREVPGSADPDSRWLQLDGGTRFVPMTGLGPSAPAAAPVETTPPPQPAPPIPTPGPSNQIDPPVDFPDSIDPGPNIQPAPPPPPRPSPRPRPMPQPMPQPNQGGDPRDTPPVGG